MPRILRRFVTILTLVPLSGPAWAGNVVEPSLRASPRDRSQVYVAGIADLPLMEGLEPCTGHDILFDKPSGRIVQSLARGRVSRGDVLDFYRAMAPQLGWAPLGRDRAGRHRFVRDGEVLEIDFPAEPAATTGVLTVRFSLSPQ